jgi:hypothetical protein
MQILPCTIIRSPQQQSAYTACDGAYFREFGVAFARSILANTDLAVHFHVFNPEPGQMEFCATDQRITVSHETVTPDQFDAAASRWSIEPPDPVSRTQLDRTVNAMGKGGDRDIRERMMKTYFACVRFVRLAEIFDPQWEMFAMDVDAVVRSPLSSPGSDHDFYIHRIHGRKARFLAGGIWLRARTQNKTFLEEYSANIADYFQRDHVYWGIDQDVLETVVPRHNHGNLPLTYIDWQMSDHSMVWTAKGTRKSDAAFLAAKSRYF